MLDRIKNAPYRVAGLVSAVAVGATSYFVAGGEALATESAAETAVKTLAEKIGSEGITIFLICITAITALLAVIVGVTLGIKKLKSFAK
jgi:predicted permease